MNYLNLGCGRVFQKDWINVDMAPKDPDVIPMDISKRLRFEDNSMDVVYHSHVLEHIPRSEVTKFMKECHRVLKPGGIIRVAVPDLEVIVRNYLRFLEQNLEEETAESRENYNWAMIELYDQSVRTVSGGEMIHYLHREDLPNKEFLKTRSSDAIRILEGKDPKRDLSYMMKLFKPLRFRVKLYVIGQLIREKLFTRVFPGGKHYKLGLFRSCGEIHQWMYDRYSLGRLLKQCGFRDPKQMTASESDIDNWNSYELDAVNGRVYKPDSLYMEAVKA